MILSCIWLHPVCYVSIEQWFLIGGPQHVNRVGHGPLYILKIGLHAE